MFLGCHDCQVMAYYPLHFVSSAVFAPMHLDKKLAAQVGKLDTCFCLRDSGMVKRNGTGESSDPPNICRTIWMESEVHLGREAIQCFLEHDRLQSDAELHHASGGTNSEFHIILTGYPSLGLIAW